MTTHYPNTILHFSNCWFGGNISISYVHKQKERELIDIK